MNKKVIFRGASAIMPLCIGDFPFSFIVGALSVSAGMSVWQSTAWSAIVIAGSAQMLALNMLKTGATLGVIIFTTLIINLRHVLYSASISGSVREASFFKKCFMSYALTDEVYATTVKEMEGNKKEKYLFYGSAMITFWAIWVLADFLGALVGASFPHIEKYGLDFAMVAAFIAIVVPQIKSRGLHRRRGCSRRFRRAVSGPTLFAGYRRRLSAWRPRRPVRRPRRKSASRWQKPNPICR